MPVKVISIVGARPQFVKAAMVADAIRAHNRTVPARKRLRHLLVHTGQHYDRTMSDVFFAQLPLAKPNYNLGVGSSSHGKQTGQLLEAIERVLIDERPSAVIAYGDTNSCVAGALAAAKLHIPLAHVEAGLRSFNRAMPEEINRVVTDHLSNFLFCPTQSAVEQLRREGIEQGVFCSGDVMLDALVRFRKVADKKSRILKSLQLKNSEYVLFTMHRAENTDSEAHIAAAIEFLLRIDRPVVFPIHPRTRSRLQEFKSLRSAHQQLTKASHVRVIDPVSYLDMLALEANARLVMTDSGGVQKEAYFLRVPCLTLRNETEWPETLEGGWNRLVPLGSDDAIRLADSVWNKNGATPVGMPSNDAFGSGHAATDIVGNLSKSLLLN